MKKLLILPALLGLTACDKPIAQSDTALYLENGSEIIASITTYPDYAIIKYNNEKIKLTKTKVNDTDIFNPSIIYSTNEDNPLHISELVALFSSDEPQFIHHYYIKLNDDDHMHLASPVTRTQYNVFREPTQTEKCIKEICDKVFFVNTPDGQFKTLVFNQEIYKYNKRRTHVNIQWKEINIPAADAIKISQNWDYANPRFYNNIDGVSDYEQDACETLERLNQYIQAQGIELRQEIFTEEDNE